MANKQLNTNKKKGKKMLQLMNDKRFIHVKREKWSATKSRNSKMYLEIGTIGAVVSEIESQIRKDK